MESWLYAFKSGKILWRGEEQWTKLREIEEKPTYRHQVNAGIYALDAKLLSLLEKNSYCDMTDLFTRGIEKGLNLNIFPLHESWLDIGRPSDYQAAKNGL